MFECSRWTQFFRISLRFKHLVYICIQRYIFLKPSGSTYKVLLYPRPFKLCTPAATVHIYDARNVNRSRPWDRTRESWTQSRWWDSRNHADLKVTGQVLSHSTWTVKFTTRIWKTYCTDNNEKKHTMNSQEESSLVSHKLQSNSVQNFISMETHLNLLMRMRYTTCSPKQWWMKLLPMTSFAVTRLGNRCLKVSSLNAWQKENFPCGTKWPKRNLELTKPLMHQQKSCMLWSRSKKSEDSCSASSLSPEVDQNLTWRSALVVWYHDPYLLQMGLFCYPMIRLRYCIILRNSVTGDRQKLTETRQLKVSHLAINQCTYHYKWQIQQ